MSLRIRMPLARDRNNVRELPAQRRHVLGDSGRGSIVTPSPFPYSSIIGVPAVKQYQLLLCINIWYLTWYVVRVASVP